ncbi:hypothetical protein ACFQY5_41190 [Paeniroseomonas aquatica]|uniref:hypothetical protein n=1 Tax=Paeniroseomonas aquatica TaxID=373043 RepID=UPI00360E60F0
MAFTHRAKGRKALDHRELLLAMAELDTDETRPPRDLATAVLARFPVAPGAGLEARSHVQLPDGSYPARRTCSTGSLISMAMKERPSSRRSPWRDA